MRASVFFGAVGLGLLSLAATARDARACGGCFHGPTQNGDPITVHRMIFSVSPQQTTLYDEIEYSGDPQSFAWVLPISGPVTVGLSADVLFAALDSATATTIVSPNLPACPSCSCAFNAGTAGSSSGGSGGGGGAPVNVISQQVVGPYDTVQLQSTDPNALTNWLTANGYSVPSNIDPIIAAYVQGGFDFLALKLQPGQGVQAMRPVRVTSAGAGMSLPLRMVAAGTGAKVGITVWVVAEGRYEPTNFPTFTVQPSELVWDWAAETSNYTTVQQAAEAAGNFATWQVESALQISPYTIESPVLADTASDDYLAIPETDAGGAAQTADQVRADDLATAFPTTAGSVWITRLRADLSQQALGTDLVLGAAASQTELSNRYQVTQSVNAPTCPAVPNPCPPCDQGASSSGGSSSGGSGSGGETTKTASPGQQSFGCSAVSADRPAAGLDLALGGLLGLSLLRARMRRNKKQ
jgi:hypothetical protein